MAETYRVRVAKGELVFSAAHFITYEGVCERLHGHNYRVAAEVAGPLDANHYVVDFVALRDELRKIIAELDHAVLLPTESSQIRVVEEGDSVIVSYESRHWEFPRDDCRLLPVANTTAELLARYLGRRLQTALAERTGGHRLSLRIEVEECEGQSAVCEM